MYQEGSERDDYSRGSRSMLGRRESLHNIESVERFCSGIVEKHLARKGGWLSYHQRRDLISFLIAEMYGMESRFDSTINDDFEGYAQKYLPLKVTDWYRKEYGDNRWSNSSSTNVSLESLMSSADEGDLGVFADKNDFTEATDSHLESRAIVAVFEHLSDEGRWIIDNVVARRAEGATIDELAAELGVSKNKIDRFISQVRGELERLVQLPDLSFLDDLDDLVAAA